MNRFQVPGVRFQEPALKVAVHFGGHPPPGELLNPEP